VRKIKKKKVPAIASEWRNTDKQPNGNGSGF
jgi:hypothetical protein